MQMKIYSIGKFTIESADLSLDLIRSGITGSEAPTIEDTLDVLCSTPIVGPAIAIAREDRAFRAGFTFGISELIAR